MEKRNGSVARTYGMKKMEVSRRRGMWFGSTERERVSKYERERELG